MLQLDLFASSAPPPRAKDAGPVETLTWGKPGPYCSGNFWTIRLYHDASGWRADGDYSMPNMGGCGPAAHDPLPAREDALLVMLRRKLREVARHIAVYEDGDCMYGPRKLWDGLATWCIQQAPPPMFGGPDLAVEFQVELATMRAREKLRCAAIRAGAKDYIGEDGVERSIYSL